MPRLLAVRHRMLIHSGPRNYGCRFRDFLWRDHRCLTLENEQVRVLVAASKGADILEFLHKPTDTECLWQSPSGLQPQQFRPSSPLDTGHFREYFAGGWYEMLPNGPGPCVHRGAHFGYHGEATLLPWDVVIAEDDPERVSVGFSVHLNRIPLHVSKTLTLECGRPTLFLSERIANEAGQRVEFLWGHHPTFGAPLLAAGTRVFVPPCDVAVPESLPADARLRPGQRERWPLVAAAGGGTMDLSVVPGPESASHDFVRLEGMEQGWFALLNPQRGVGFALSFDARLFGVLGYWQLFGGGPDYPWYQRHFLAALEPACDLPSLSDAVARGTAIALDPLQSVETTFEATLFIGLTEVRAVEPGGLVL